MKKEAIKELKKMYESTLAAGFSYENISKIEKKFGNKNPEIENFIEDFNNFCLLVAGSCTYVLSNKKIPKYQRKNLERDFFSQYPEYYFIQAELGRYSDLYRELKSIESARELLIEIIWK